MTGFDPTSSLSQERSFRSPARLLARSQTCWPGSGSSILNQHYFRFGERATKVIFRIRKASTGDAEAIVEVLDHAPFLKDCYRGEAGISLVENNPDIFWLADLDGRVASVMIVQRKYDFGRLEISLIVTKPEFRRRDYARGLIRKAKQIAAEDKVDLVAYPENDISRDLFIIEQFRLVPSEEKHPMYRFSGTKIEPR